MRRLLFLLAISTSLYAKPAQVRPITVVVREGPSITVTIPDMSKEQLVAIVSDFFSKGDEDAAKKFNATFGKAKSITLIVTTNR